MSDDLGRLARYYDEYYFLQRPDVSPEPYSRDNPVWQTFFGEVADRIVAELRPRTVLDAGCGIGFLVEALRDRGVEAWGLDVSERAISEVREDVRPYCRVGSVTDELERDYELVVCIEVLEHLPPRLAERAVGVFARHTGDVLFSSTPDDFREPSHVNVQPADYWVGLFARYGFYRDVEFDTSFVSSHAIRLKRLREFPVSVLRAYERAHVRTTAELRELRAASMAAVEERARLDRERAADRKRIEELEARVGELEAASNGGARG